MEMGPYHGTMILLMCLVTYVKNTTNWFLGCTAITLRARINSSAQTPSAVSNRATYKDMMFLVKRNPPGVSLDRSDQDVEWKESERVAFGRGPKKGMAFQKFASARELHTVGTGNSSALRKSALRRSSCTRSIHSSSQALDLLDAEICSDHILVNAERERVSDFLKPLQRSEQLDEIAREHAEAMAVGLKTFHSDPTEMMSKLGDQPHQRFGENVARGNSIEYIHFKMTNRRPDFANMLDWRFNEMGMATAVGSDGKIYLCQLFRG